MVIWIGIMFFNEPWRFVLRVRPNMIDKVKRIVKITGYVNCEESFVEHPRIINGASDFLIEIFGEIGRHSRVAVGVNSLPLNAPVEIDFIIQLQE